MEIFKETENKIDLLKANLDRPAGRPEQPFSPGPKRKSGKFKTLIFCLVFLVVALVIFSFKNSSGDESSAWYYHLPIISQIKHLVESADAKLKGEDRDRINILLLGIGGKSHEGGLLTDTIILASLKPSEKKVALVSVPRDLAVPVENLGLRKINNINAFAETKNPGSGGLALSQTVSDIFQTPIDYYLTVDFTGFEKIIDDLGGVKINVVNAFDDYKYPILGKEDAPWEERWEHLHFDRGAQLMDGGTALKFVRSRHAEGIEGSDFARSRRQQQVLEAVKEKVLSLRLLLKPSLLSKIVEDIKDNYNTNLKVWEMIKLWGLVKDIKGESIYSRVLDNSSGGLLVDTIGEDGSYLLAPKSGDFSEIQYLVNNIFTDAPLTDKEKVSEEKATLEVRNGTWINGLASQAALDLEKYGFKIVRIGNSNQQNFEKTVIYDLTYGAKINALSILQNKTKATVALGMPEWLINDLAKELAKETNPVQPDFIIILGQDADTTRSGTANPEQ